MFGLEKRHKQCIDSFLIKYSYSFYVYGSRAKGTEKITSDLDLCIFSNVQWQILAEIKEGLNNLMLPFSVDVVSWPRLSNEFKALIKSDLIAYCIDPYLGAVVTELSHPIDTSIYTPNIDNINLQSLYAPCSIFVAPTTIDTSFVISENMIKEHEECYGPIAANSWFLIMAGFNAKVKLSLQATNYLMQKKILGLGINTEFIELDETLLKAGIYIIENLVYYKGAWSNSAFLQVTALSIANKTKSTAQVLLVKQSN